MRFTLDNVARAALVALAFCASGNAFAVSVGNPNATMTVVEGDAVRIAPDATVDPLFHVRIVDANGAPLRGIIVQIFPDSCLSFPGLPNTCAPPDLYGHFEDQDAALNLVTDANGVATAPAFVGGPGPAVYLVAACVWVNGVPQNAAIGTPFCLDLEVDQVTMETAVVPITSAFTGAWFDPEQSGHGLMLEVLDDHRLLAYWFAFDPNGAPTWFGGVGRIENDLAIVEADTGANGAWIPNFDPATYHLLQWGTLMFQFTDCDHGRVDFTGNFSMSAFGYGEMSLTRLTHPAGLACDE
jgi:hypothetical protein